MAHSDNHNQRFVDLNDGTSALALSDRPYLQLLSGGRSSYAAAAYAADTELRIVRELSRRMRYAVLALAFIFVVLFLMMRLNDVHAAQLFTRAVNSTTYEELVVQQGDSLWTIAASNGIDGLDTAHVVKVIEQRNGLTEAGLHPGQRLFVPAH
jgi:hypothetical protein